MHTAGEHLGSGYTGKVSTSAARVSDFVRLLIYLLFDCLFPICFSDNVPFATAENTTQLRSCEALVRYVLEIAAQKVEAIRNEPDYKQLSYSKRTLKLLTDITKVVYERCIRRLPDMWREFDLESAVLATKCFMQCIRTAHETYAKRFKEFVKGFGK